MEDLKKIFGESILEDALVLTKEMNNLQVKGSRVGLYKKEIVEPNILEINRRTGQVNEPMFLAYMLDYNLNKGVTHDENDQSV